MPPKKANTPKRAAPPGAAIPSQKVNTPKRVVPPSKAAPPLALAAAKTPAIGVPRRGRPPRSGKKTATGGGDVTSAPAPATRGRQSLSATGQGSSGGVLDPGSVAASGNTSRRTPGVRAAVLAPAAPPDHLSVGLGQLDIGGGANAPVSSGSSSETEESQEMAEAITRLTDEYFRQKGHAKMSLSVLQSRDTLPIGVVERVRQDTPAVLARFEEIHNDLLMTLLDDGQIATDEVLVVAPEIIWQLKTALGLTTDTGNDLATDTAIARSLDASHGTIKEGNARDAGLSKKAKMPPGYFDKFEDDPAQIKLMIKELDKLKLEIFTGEPGSPPWSTWWEQFREKVHRLPQSALTDSRKLEILLKYLGGKAAKLLGLGNRSLITQVGQYATILERLQEYYGVNEDTLSDLREELMVFRPENNSQEAYLSFANQVHFLTLQLVHAGNGLDASHREGADALRKRMPQGSKPDFETQCLAHIPDDTPEVTRYRTIFQWIQRRWRSIATAPSAKTADKPASNAPAVKGDNQPPKGGRAPRPAGGNPDPAKEGRGSNRRRSRGGKRVYRAAFGQLKCPLHEANPANHFAEECSLSNKQRRESARSKNLCYRCLQPGHSAKDCNQPPVKRNRPGDSNAASCNNARRGNPPRPGGSRPKKHQANPPSGAPADAGETSTVKTDPDATGSGDAVVQAS
jgi:hypothetical protein